MTKHVSILSRIAARRPLICCISNFVSASFCADALLAIGASPVMTGGRRDATEMCAIADALYLNIGTVDEESLAVMCDAACAAKKRGIPVVFDPVGVGATPFRNEAAQKILAFLPDIVKGNLSEMLFLAGDENISTHGVDRGILSGNEKKSISLLKQFSRDHRCIAIATGEKDHLADGEKTAAVTDSEPMLEKISGTGCVLGAFCAAAAAVSGKALDAQTAIVCAMSLAGKKARQKRSRHGSFKSCLLDELGMISDADIRNEGRYEFFA